MGINKFTLQLEGQPYEVERRGDLLIVNGIEYTCQVKEAQTFIGGTPHAVKLAASTVEVDGIAYAYQTSGLAEPGTAGKRKASASAAEEAGAVLAVMPGLIIKLLKKEGDTVAAGEVILILEAMKMQNDIQAKVGGRIVQMNVKQGDNVEMRQVLCLIE
jgi:glutaconyl-CoA/methylmalonyl-CoA decarboxylase subunit gamma